MEGKLLQVIALTVPTAAITRELARSTFFAFICFEALEASLLQFGAILSRSKECQIIICLDLNIWAHWPLVNSIPHYDVSRNRGIGDIYITPKLRKLTDEAIAKH